MPCANCSFVLFHFYCLDLFFVFLQVLSVRIVNVIVLLMVVVSKHCD